MGFYIFGHGGSADHGCEDRLRGICSLLPQKPEIRSDHPEEDWRYGLGALGGVYRRGTGKSPGPGDWCLDLRLRSREPEPGVKRIFWGSHMGMLDQQRLRQLGDYDIVAVSELRTHDRLTAAGLSNVVMAPEPAFLVKEQLREGEFPPNTVGLCLTCPPAAGSVLYRCYRHLIRYLLHHTDLHIALIPYSVRTGQNDLFLHRALAAPYLYTGRVHIRPDGDSPLLRGDLSRCRCCVGGAGVLAAWSCEVPGLCLSATHRTLGLAQAIFGTPQAAVCPWEQLTQEDQLTRRFQQFLQTEDWHRRRLGARRGEI